MVQCSPENTRFCLSHLQYDQQFILCTYTNTVAVENQKQSTIHPHSMLPFSIRCRREDVIRIRLICERINIPIERMRAIMRDGDIEKVSLVSQSSRSVTSTLALAFAWQHPLSMCFVYVTVHLRAPSIDLESFQGTSS